MLVAAEHRARTGRHSADEYRELASRCTSALSRCTGITSIIICGSVVKDDVIEGWSDLDLVVFFQPGVTSAQGWWDELRDAVQRAGDGFAIGIGIDLVDSTEFATSNRLGGRPLAMTYEVAAYGSLGAGTWPFPDSLGESINAVELTREAQLLHAAELHNWRRALVATTRPGLGSQAWVGYCVKTALKLLKYRTGPLLGPAFTHAAGLERLRAVHPDDPLLAMFGAAVAVRAKWPRFLDGAEVVDEDIKCVETGLYAGPSAEFTIELATESRWRRT